MPRNDPIAVKQTPAAGENATGARAAPARGYARLLAALIEPTGHIVDPAERRRCRLLAGLLLIYFPSTLIGAYFAGRQFGLPVGLSLSVVGGIGGIGYVLGRLGRSWLGATVTIAASALAPFVQLGLIGEYNELAVMQRLMWLFPPLLLSYIFLSPREMIFWSAAICAGILLLPWILPPLDPETLVGPLGLVVVLALLLLIGMLHRAALERDARALLEQQRQALAAARDELEERVAQRTLSLLSLNHQLEESRVAAEKANQLKSDFLATMSHEIRTPMNGVLGMLALLLETAINEQQREYAETAATSARALLDIINDILDLSKVEAGKLTLVSVRFDLVPLIEEVLDHVAAAAGAKQLEVLVRYEPGMPRAVVGDPGRFRQILTNLVSNAVKFTERGHVLINLGGDGPPGGRAQLRIEVSDTGIGIPVEQQAAIFEKFRQVDSSLSRKHGGTGLGLAICRELVTLMGGEIGVTSTVGEGTMFWLSLPLVAATADAPQGLAELAGLRVLSVVEHPLARRILSETLTTWGMRATGCSSGLTAVETLRMADGAGDPFAMVLVEHGLADVDVLELPSKLHRPGSRPALSWILITQLSQRPRRSRLKAAGFAGYLSKPLHLSALRDVLAATWANRMQHDGAPLTARHSTRVDPDSSVVTALTPGIGSRVLLVEDNAVNQQVARQMLLAFGCQVDIASNGREALALAQAVAYDIVFMDVQMPEMDGYEATRILREREAGTDRHLPIVAMTAHAMAGDRETCLAAGMDGYVAKPIDRAELAGVITQFWTP